ncbi:MAG TPA: hypothetical protein GX405_00470 [Rhizobiales bacterium]|nr:hypothetical protein [Hyphomicrobiales bacterium]
MRKTFATLIASTALVTGAGIPAWSAMHRAVWSYESREAATDVSDAGAPLIFAGDHRRHDRNHERRFGRGDDDDDRDDDDDDDDDDNGYRGGAGGPAPAGTVAPPNNGLFGSGAAPKVRVN